MPRLSKTKGIESLLLFATDISATGVTIQINYKRRSIINLKQRYNVPF